MIDASSVRGRGLVLLASLAVGLVASDARAECWDSSDEGHVLGVAPDGSFVYEREWGSEAGGSDNHLLEVHDRAGALRLSFTGCTDHVDPCDAGFAKGQWKTDGGPEPALRTLVSDRPSPEALAKRLLKALGLTPLRRSTTTLRALARRLPPARDDVSPDTLDNDEFGKRRWRKKVLEHPSSPLYFVEMSYVARTHVVASCVETFLATRWLPRLESQGTSPSPSTSDPAMAK
jgi:hypothetical protein